MSDVAGVRLALDWGKARIGVAACDITGTLAYPVETIDAAQAISRLRQVVDEKNPISIIVGLPIDLKGNRGIAAQYVLERAHEVADLVDIPVFVVDERLSTVTASRSLGQAGRRAKAQRSVIDQAAAVEIMRSALDQLGRGRLLELVPKKEEESCDS